MFCDWLQYTMTTGVNVAYPWEGHSERWQDQYKGRNGYLTTWRTPFAAQIMSDGTKDMGVHVVLSGSVLRALADHGHTAQDIAEYVVQHRGHFTRVDIAADSNRAGMSPAYAMQAEREGRVTRTAHGELRWVGKGDGPLQTLYSGERGGQAIVRVYDKRIEQSEKGVPLDTLPKHWTRAEWEFRADKAVLVGNAMAAGDVARIATECRKVFAVRMANEKDSNRARWALDPAWVELLGENMAERATNEVQDLTTWAQADAWLKKAVAATFAAVYEHAPDPDTWLAEFLELGRQSTSTRTKNIIASVHGGQNPAIVAFMLLDPAMYHSLWVQQFGEDTTC